MPRLSDRIVLYFTAGPVPTAPELATIAAIEGTIKIRNGSAPTSQALYGAAIEPCDACAGTIPTAYSGKPVASPSDNTLPTTSAVVANAATVAVRNSAGADSHPGTAVVAAKALTGINLAATAAIVDQADVVIVQNSAGAAPQNASANVSAGVLSNVRLPATVAMIVTAVGLVVPVTGVFVTTITPTVASGVITGFVLS